MIHNAEIHIIRADPGKHDGEKGFVYAITFGSEHHRSPKGVVFRKRQAAAAAAAIHIDEQEIRTKLDELESRERMASTSLGANVRDI